MYHSLRSGTWHHHPHHNFGGENSSGTCPEPERSEWFGAPSARCHEPVDSLRFMASHIPLAEFTLNPSAASGSGLGYISTITPTVRFSRSNGRRQRAQLQPLRENHEIG